VKQDFVRQRMNATGIGFAGIDGVWWLPACEPFVLPSETAVALTEIGGAIFALFDVVQTLFDDDRYPEIRALLRYKVPESLQRWMGNGRVLSVRPDFQLRPSPGGYEPIVTELEICPSAHGFAHAMQMGYGLATDLVDEVARFLNGRTLIFVSTAQWSEFLFEQLAFCRALAEVGARGRVLLDVPLAALADEITKGQRWQPPMFGVQKKTADWDDDVLGRIEKHRLGAFFCGLETGDWPDEVGDAVVFRFGYCDCFASEKLAYFGRWQDAGATLLNPASFIWDSKVVMALVGETAVRQHLPADILNILDRCIPETRLLQPDNLAEILAEKDDWIIKFAGFDGDNQAWGGRSLQVGAAHSAAGWRQVVEEAAQLSWPVVAQHAVPSAQVDVAYWDADDEARWLRNGRTRLRAFYLRDGEDTAVCGTHITVSGGGLSVSESTDAVQAPVRFSGSELARINAN
jgi:hypothetical protein